MKISNDIIYRYLNRRVEDIQDLKISFAQSDYEKMIEVGHKLKGNGRTFGYPEITQLGEEIEQAADSKDKIKLIKCIDSFEICVKNGLNNNSNDRT